MNCRPGDLAVIVKPAGKQTLCLVGKIVRVTVAVYEGGEWCWEYEGERLLQSRFGVLWYIEDDLLRPIRPDGVADDEVRKLYAPQTPEVA